MKTVILEFVIKEEADQDRFHKAMSAIYHGQGEDEDVDYVNSNVLVVQRLEN